MKLKMMTVGLLAVGLLIFAACSSPQPAEVQVEPEAQVEPAAEQPTVAQVAEEPATPTTAPTDTPEPLPTDAPDTPAPAAEDVPEEAAEDTPEEPEADAAVAESPVQFGRTEEGAFYYGSPTASIKLIDHSDFL